MKRISPKTKGNSFQSHNTNTPPSNKKELSQKKKKASNDHSVMGFDLAMGTTGNKEREKRKKKRPEGGVKATSHIENNKEVGNKAEYVQEQGKASFRA